MSSTIPSLSHFLAVHPDARRIVESSLSHSEALAAINSLPEALAVGFQTSRTSVIRARQRERKPSLAEVVEPGSEPLRPVQPRRQSLPNWSPGKEIDLGNGTGELRTRPLPVTEQIDPEDERILQQFGLDPAKWEIAGYRESRWDQVTAAGDERELSAYRVSVRRRVQQLDRLDENTISAILHGYSARPRQGKGSGTLAVPIADIQTGKPEGGGTAAIVERFGKLVADVRQRIEDDFGGHLEALVVPVVGDLVEGCTSQGGRLANDLGVSEQLRVVRRLIMHFFAVLAPLADRVLVLVIPGNHGEVRRDRATTARDNWDVEAVVGVQDALEIAGGYEHVTFAYPNEDDMSLAVELDGVVIGATHGHVVGTQDRFGQWLAGQALGKQPVGQCDLLFAGHHHTFRMQDLGGGRTLVACPAMDGGSAWFTNRKGVSSHVGMVSMEITTEAPYWRAPVLHTA